MLSRQPVLAFNPLYQCGVEVRTKTPRSCHERLHDLVRAASLNVPEPSLSAEEIKDYAVNTAEGGVNEKPKVYYFKPLMYFRHQDKSHIVKGDYLFRLETGLTGKNNEVSERRLYCICTQARVSRAAPRGSERKPSK